jgi:hypothetical protein
MPETPKISLVPPVIFYLALSMCLMSYTKGPPLSFPLPPPVPYPFLPSFPPLAAPRPWKMNSLESRQTDTESGQFSTLPPPSEVCQIYSIIILANIFAGNFAVIAWLLSLHACSYDDKKEDKNKSKNKKKNENKNKNKNTNQTKRKKYDNKNIKKN